MVWVAWWKEWRQMHTYIDIHTSGCIVGTLTDLWDRMRKQVQDWKSLECWLGRISIILTLIKWNGMNSQKMFVLGKSQELSQCSVSDKCQKQLWKEQRLFLDLLNEKMWCFLYQLWHLVARWAKKTHWWTGRFPWFGMEYLKKQLLPSHQEDKHYYYPFARTATK